MKKIANRDARYYVEKLLPFKGNNTWGENKAHGAYVVYSYGFHWPMFIYAEGVWFENGDKYSVTTKKHTSQCRPSGVETAKRSTHDLRKIAEYGICALTLN